MATPTGPSSIAAMTTALPDRVDNDLRTSIPLSRGSDGFDGRVVPAEGRRDTAAVIGRAPCCWTGRTW
jgi:hypothetical protein